MLRQVERVACWNRQTTVNFLIHDKNVDFKWFYEYNMCDMVRKEHSQRYVIYQMGLDISV